MTLITHFLFSFKQTWGVIQQSRVDTPYLVLSEKALQCLPDRGGFILYIACDSTLEALYQLEHSD